MDIKVTVIKGGIEKIPALEPSNNQCAVQKKFFANQNSDTIFEELITYWQKHIPLKTEVITKTLVHVPRSRYSYALVVFKLLL